MNYCKHFYQSAAIVPLPGDGKPIRARGRRAGFSQVELMVVMATIILLAALLIPVVGSIRDVSARTQGLSNLRSLTSAGLIYAGDHYGYLPNTYFEAQAENNPVRKGESSQWFREIHPYVYGEGNMLTPTGGPMVDGLFRSPYLGAYERNADAALSASWARIDFINVNQWRPNSSHPWIRMNLIECPSPPDMPFLLTGYNNGSAGLGLSASFRRYCYHPDSGGPEPTRDQLPRGTAWVYNDSLLVGYADGRVEAIRYQPGENMYAIVFNQR